MTNAANDQKNASDATVFPTAMSPATTFRTTTGDQIPRRLLGIWAHPDDEAYLSAGLMGQTIDRGGKVTVVAITDGEAGFPADDGRSSAQRAAHRRAELRAAMDEIGVTDVRFLGAPDGGLAQADPTPLVASMAEIMREVRPDAVVGFGPDGITGHEDHIAGCRLVTKAWLQCNLGQLWYAAKTTSWLAQWRELHDRFGVWMTEEPVGVEDDAVEMVIDLGPNDLERKRRVMKGHSSQTDGLAAAFGEQTYRSWIAQETFRRPTTNELLAVDPMACTANWCYSSAFENKSASVTR